MRETYLGSAMWLEVAGPDGPREISLVPGLVLDDLPDDDPTVVMWRERKILIEGDQTPGTVTGPALPIGDEPAAPTEPAMAPAAPAAAPVASPATTAPSSSVGSEPGTGLPASPDIASSASSDALPTFLRDRPAIPAADQDRVRRPAPTAEE